MIALCDLKDSKILVMVASEVIGRRTGKGRFRKVTHVMR